jgi:signal transduction histidine kinase
MEEQVSHLEELEGLNSELEGFITDLKGREEGYSSRITDLEERLAELKGQAEASAAALHETRNALVREISKAAALASERDELASKLEAVSRLLDEEKGRSAEKDVFISSSRSAVRDKEAEAERIWKSMEELKTELASERAAVRDRDAQLQKAAKVREALEQKLQQAARDAERSEQGFLQKINLVKKELKDQALRGEELQRGLAAAGTRLDEALEEAAHKEKLLAGARAALAEKEAQLKAAGQQIRALAKEAGELRGGRGRDDADRARALAASLADRVKELEADLAESGADSLEKFRASQSALADTQSALRRKEEENASLRAKESSMLKDLQDAEEKWKLSEVQLHNAVSRLRAAENDNEISEGRIKTLEAERDKFRAAAVKAEALFSRLAAQEALARDGEAAGLMAALGEQSAKYAELLRKYDDLVLAGEAAAREAAELRELAARLEAEAAGAAERERARYAKLSEKMHNADALLKKKEFELEEARGALAALEGECEMLRGSRSALGQKYASEIKAENELVNQVQAKVAERDAVIARLAAAEEDLKKEAEELKKERKELLALLRKKSSNDSGAKLREAEKLIAENESRMTKLRMQLETAAAEKAELAASEKELKAQLESKPYRAMLREAEEKLFIKERMLSELNARMKKLGGDFEELKRRGQAPAGPGYMPEFEELVAGLGHQIANSISIIRSHAEFCAESPEADGAKESLSVIVRNIVALQRKIDTIMNFSRPVIPQRSPERVAGIASETLESLKAAGRLEGIRTRVDAPAGLKPINVDRVRLAAAVEQLLLNAAEAMPQGGQLTLRLSSSGGRQRLEVTDTGEGIEKKNFSSVFHPFFTTRPGKMGLGLTLARNVARAHGGTLELRSEPGRGTTAALELPEA